MCKRDERGKRALGTERASIHGDFIKDHIGVATSHRNTNDRTKGVSGRPKTQGNREVQK